MVPTDPSVLEFEASDRTPQPFCLQEDDESAILFLNKIVHTDRSADALTENLLESKESIREPTLLMDTSVDEEDFGGESNDRSESY
jgi:hypothetical protein